MNRGSSVGIATGNGLDDRMIGVRFAAGLGILLIITASRPALGPTQPPIQWVPGALSLGVKRPGRKADHSPPTNAEVKECVELYLHSPLRLNGVVKIKLFLCSLNWARRPEGVLGEWRLAPRILDLGTRWMWVVNFTTWPLYPMVSIG
jgi:hypothetical protein